MTIEHDESGERGSRRAPSRRYDSFLVRVWRQPGQARLMRAEVRHVQSGQLESAIDCEPDWLGDAIEARLDEAGD